jgi:DNA-binding transcriptional LysR family regulator
MPTRFRDRLLLLLLLLLTAVLGFNYFLVRRANLENARRTIDDDLRSAAEWFDRVALVDMRLVAAGPTADVLTADNLQRTYAGRLDVLIVALPCDCGEADSSVLWRDRFSLAVHGDDPLALAKHVKPDQLAPERLLLLQDGHCLRDQALDVCSRVRVHEDQDYRATSLETLRQMVAAGHGITLLPELASASPVGTSRGLRVKHFAKPAPARTIGAVWRKSTTRRVAIDAVLATIRTAMHEESKK